MSIPTGFRPRTDAERLQTAHVLHQAPARVGIGFADDGWIAANLWIGGHVPVWTQPAPNVLAERTLARLGLPPMGSGAFDAELRADLKWVSPPTAASAPLPPAVGPLVTILVCTYNRAHLIEAALRSALAQTWPCEILVVDDGSTDGTAALLAGIDGLRVVQQVPNQGKPAALARGLAEAHGEAILILDDDDLLLPGALHVLATALFADPSRVAAWGDTVVFDDATTLPTSIQTACRLPPELQRRSVLLQIPAMPGATLIRTSAWRAVGPLDPRLIRGQDMDLFLALARLGPAVNVPVPTFWYRSHDALRGSAAGQWNKSDAPKHRARFLSFVKPVFRDRWRQFAPGADRAEGHAWALGLFQRDLFDEARAELARWPGPWSPAEAWMRTQIGLRTVGVPGEGVLVVVDDGDEGALEALLAREAGQRRLWVDLEVPRDPLGNVKLYWPGAYGAREVLSAWVKEPGPWHVRLTSAPDWAPPPVDPRLLPPVRGTDALAAVTAVLDWPLPDRVRAGIGVAPGVGTWARRAREALRAGNPKAAMLAIAPLLEAHPGWRGAWSLAAEAFTLSGHDADAAECRVKAA